MNRGKVYIGVPAYGRMIDFGNATACMNTGYPEVMVTYGSISLLAYNFNRLWTDAHNKRKSHNLSHFCMIHADIAPEPGFLGKMMDIMEQRELDCLSAVSPLKGVDGYTSCALEMKGWTRQRRITLKECELLPRTFTGEDTKRVLGSERLLVNTGLLLLDLTRFDPMKFHFSITDTVEQNADGSYAAKDLPEDWDFSRRMMKGKKKYAATKEVGLMHVGTYYWTNQDVFGKETDRV